MGFGQLWVGPGAGKHADYCQPRRTPGLDVHVHVADADAVHRAEEQLDIDALVTACLVGLEKTDYGPEYTPSHWGA